MGDVERHWLRWVVCGLVIVAFAACAPPVWADAEDDYDVAVALYQKERWADAAASFQRFLSAHPEHDKTESALLYSGFALVNAGDYAKAREAFERFVSRFPESNRAGDALYRLGETSYSLGDYQRAAEEFREFLKQEPEHELREWALPYLGDSELRLKEYEKAEEHFRATIEQFPEGPLTSEAEFGLGRSLDAQGQNEQAIATFEKIAGGDGPRAAASQMRVATILFDTEKYAEASQEFRALIERFPESEFVATARLNAGFAAYRARNLDEAVAALKEAARTGANAATASYWLGMAQKARGNLEEAAEAFETVVNEHPRSKFVADGRFQWADSALRSGQTKKALELYEQIATADPPGEHAAAATYFAGEAAMMLGDVNRAESLVARFEREHAKSAYRMHGRLLAGRVREARAKSEEISESEATALEEEALANYQSVLEETKVDSTAAKARFQIARLHEQREEHEKSLTALEPLLETISQEGADSPHLDALILAARNQIAAGQFADAIEAATTYLELAPEGALAREALSRRAVARVAAKEASAARDDWEKLQQRSGEDATTLLPIARELAERAYGTEQFSVAADFFQEVVTLAGDRPEGALGLSGLGWALHEAGDHKEASEAFGELLRRYPSAPRLALEAAYMKGKTLQDGGDLAGAASAYRSAFETFAPDKPLEPGAEARGTTRNIYLAGLQLARVLRLQHKIEESDAAYAALVEAFPEPANLDRLLEEWALLHYEAGNYARADELYRRLLKERPGSRRAASARLALAESAMMKGDYKETISTAETILDSESATQKTRRRARSMLISVAAEQGQWEQVAATSSEYLKQVSEGGERPLVMYLRGEALLQTGKVDEAKKMLSQIEAESGKVNVREENWFPRVKLLLAEANFQEKDYEAALQRLDEFDSITPRPDYAYTAHELRGRIFKQQAKFEKAREAYQNVLNDDAAHRTETAARAQYGVAETYFLQHEWEEARTEALRVYTLYKFPQWQAPALLMVGLTDELMGNPEEAADTFKAVRAEFPESSEAEKAREKLESLGVAAGG